MSSNDENDYEKQFEADLAKAIALSLETSEYEKFRNEQRMKYVDVCEPENASSKNMLEPYVLKSRPRPEPYSAAAKKALGLPPPPSSVRKNSSASVVVDDLISFHSPSKDEAKTIQDELTSASDEFQDWNSGNMFSSDFSNLNSSKNRHALLYPDLNLMFPSNLSSSDNASAFKTEQLDCSEFEKDCFKTNESFNHPVLTMTTKPIQFGFKREVTDFFQTFNQRPPSVGYTSYTPQNTGGPNSSCLSVSSCPSNGSSGSSKLKELTSLDILKVVGKRQNNNLIDLMPDNHSELRNSDSSDEFSVLEAFDPLTVVEKTTTVNNDSSKDNKNEESKDEDEDEEDKESVCSGSFYDPFDPFDYMYSPTSIDGSQGDPVYAAVINNKLDKPPPLPPRNCDIATRRSGPENFVRQKSRLFENIEVLKRRAALHSSDLQSFYNMVRELRQQFVYTDAYTNVGLIVSPTIENNYTSGTSIKLVVHSSNYSQPIPFTCDLSSSVEHVIVQVICTLEGDMVGSVTDYVLKVFGLSEYLTSDTCLGDYEYVHQCIKLEKDVALCIMHITELRRPLARTIRDDTNDQSLTLEDLLPNEPVQPISYETLVILLETIEREMDKIIVAARDISTNNSSNSMPLLQPSSVTQAIKAVCALMGHVETIEISEALAGFTHICSQFIPAVGDNTRAEITSDDGDYSIVRVSNAKSRLEESILVQCDKIREAVRSLIESYCHAFNVDFQLSARSDAPTGIKTVLEFKDTVIVHVGGLHRLHGSWSHTEYIVGVQIYHGTRPVKNPSLSRSTKPSVSFYKRVAFDSWLSLDGTTVAGLPREARLVFVLYGLTLLPPDHELSKENPNEPQYDKVELGWAAIQFFNHDGVLTQGSFLLSIWPTVADKRFSPAPVPGTHPQSSHPVLRISLPNYGGNVLFPKLPESNIKAPMYEFASLDKNTQQLLLDMAEQDTFSKPRTSDREVLWEKRHYLHNVPQALPKVLLATQCWDYSSLSDLHAMVHCWSPMEPLSALQLLLPCFADSEVRSVAISWIRELISDELVDYLPQLVQALKHETYEASQLAKFLLERALTSPRVAHHLYWLLVQTLPGSSPQNTSDVLAGDDVSIGAYRYHRRLQIMLRALLAISGEALRQRFLSQQLLVKSLYEVAENVKKSKESLRLKTLQAGLEVLHHSLQESSTSLPLSPSVCVVGVQVRTCSYFPSNTLPLKINFLSDENRIFPAIFKVGDYLQQDMLTIQMIRIMDKLWLKEGLDLKMVTFTCVPTGHKRGMIELVDNSETLRKIQVEHGLTGSFKDRPIAEWLAKHNPSTLEYERAVWNFTASCAGYSVATYILGICDRHNDNIMLKTSGHLFHIDFGKFLGDAQMFGNFKRDRSPFVLTSDMAYVINGGDKPSQRFHHFVDLCCKAFSIVRKNGNVILNLFGLMVSSGIPGVTSDAVRYVQRALLPDKSNPEASAMFARMIDSSLKSWFTQFNFFLHNLSQLRFTGDHNDGELLSFIPKRYTCEEEGRIRRVQVYGCQKRYDSEKYYIYILKVDRRNQPDSTYLFRTYREFCEFHQKLCTMFPLAKCHSLPAGIQIGRSNIKQVAEKRKIDIEKFLVSLFKMADEISHSDIVYTFFHPLLRDQEEADINIRKVKERKTNAVNESHMIRGQLKLSIEYQTQKETLMVMVHHVRGLPKIAGGQEPSTYVKVYLLPDHNKSTKRKTKVVRKNCHPTFMEMLEYRMSLDIVRRRTLQATVWSHDSLQENEFLGGVNLPLETLPLTSETCEWYSLGNVPR